jgi:hypothetical protein
MRVPRLMFAILVPVVIFATVGCGRGGAPTPGPGFKPSPAGSRSLKCESDVDVIDDQQHKHGVDKETIYVCEDSPLTWKQGPKVTSFTIDFQGGNCSPFFSSCHFTESSPTLTINPGPPGSSPFSQQPLAVFKYSIKVNGIDPPYDPQVIGGGGH